MLRCARCPRFRSPKGALCKPCNKVECFSRNMAKVSSSTIDAYNVAPVIVEDDNSKQADSIRHQPFRLCRKRQRYCNDMIPSHIYPKAYYDSEDEESLHYVMKEPEDALSENSEGCFSFEDEASLETGSEGSESETSSVIVSAEHNGGLDHYNDDSSTPTLSDPISMIHRRCVVSDSFRKCRNCHREEIKSGLAVYQVTLFPISRDDISCAGKWKSFIKADLKKSESVLLLCKECLTLLSKESEPTWKKEWKFIWPVYIWLLISNKHMIDKHGADVARFIPKQWHVYWKKSLCILNDVFTDEAFTRYGNSVPVTVDVTEERDAFLGIIDRLKLGELKQGCNEYLMPLILCPWGCSSYAFHEGFISMDALYGRFFPYVDYLGYIKRNETEKVFSCRDDYFGDLIDAWYFNPEWTVNPSVAYIKGHGPVFLTCKDHHKGTYKQYFHLPRTDHCLPTKFSDSLSHAVLRARTLRPCKAHKFSHSYQLNKTVAHYGGIDSTTVTEHRYFDYTSHLTDVSEARSFAGRLDIKGLAQKLNESGVLSDEFLENLEQRSQDLYGHNDILEKCCRGGNMMSLHDSIKLQKMISSSSMVSVRTGTSSSQIQRLWPSHLVFIHSNDNYGGRFTNYIISSRSDIKIDLRCIWFVANAMLCVPALWNLVDIDVRRTEHWNGYMLAYLSRKVLRHQSQRKGSKTNNPFHVKKNDDRMKPAGLQAMLLRLSSKELGAFQWKTDMLFGVFNRSIKMGRLVMENLQRNALARLQLFPNRISPDCDVVMFLRPKGSKLDSPLPLSCGTGKNTFELRFLCCTNKTGKGPVGNKWNGQIFARHGGSLFKGWWSFDRDTVPRHCEDFGIVAWDHVDEAIYVRCSSVSIEEYRRQYLIFVGGQNKVVCDKHDVPLITSISKRKCDALECSCHNCPEKNKRQELSCPVKGCLAGICSGCLKTLAPTITSRVPAPGDCRDETFASNYTICLSDDEDDDEQSDNVINDSMASYIGEMLPTGDEAGIYDLHGDFGEEYDERLITDDLPTTHCSAESLEFDTTIGTIGTSVFLNKCGTLLVRKDNTIRASRKERNLIERVVSAPAVGTVPLVYLESVLFPSIFWCMPHPIDGGVLGSMPTSLFCQHSTRNQYNIASAADHARTRIKSIGNVASMDNRYLAFQFDTLANGALEGQDSRVVINRGFEECMGPAGVRMRNADDDFYTDSIDNKQNVHNLCASEREKTSDLFVTLTCNQRDHFGTSKVKRYIDDGMALDNYKKHREKLFPLEKPLTLQEEQEVQNSLVEASRNLICRNWLEVKTLLLKYILKSPEKPFGDVLKIFCRDEYQCECGNLCHLHMLITLAKGYDTEEGKKFIQLLIRGFTDEIVGFDEVEQYIKEGILDSWDDYETMKEQARRILPHVCTKRCKRRTGIKDEDEVCRKPDTRKISYDLTKFCEVKLNVTHDPGAVEVLSRLGMCKDPKTTCGEFIPIEEFLESKRIHATARHGEGLITTTIGRFFAATRSSMNVQICTSFGTSRYIVKYIIKIDEHNYIAFHIKEGSNNVIKAEQVHLANTKVTSSAMNENRRLKRSRHKDRIRGRAVSATEMMQIILGYPQIYTNIHFVRVPTLPLGDRAGVEQESPRDRQLRRNNATDSVKVIPSMISIRYKILEGCSQNRFHTSSQEHILFDQLDSIVSLDRVTIFGIRPPEILFIDKMEWYFRFFERSHNSFLHQMESSNATEFLHKKITQTRWIDGFGYEITIRNRAAEELLSVIQSTEVKAKAADLNLEAVRNLMTDICHFLLKGASHFSHGKQKQVRRFRGLYLSGNNSPLPVIVFSNVQPRNASKFVIHLLLSMGHFITEQDLWTKGSMREAFVSARLIRRDFDSQNEEHVKQTLDFLLDAWIRDQLRFYPIGSRKFDEFIINAQNILHGVLVHDTICMTELPPYLYTSLVQEYKQIIIQYRNECKMQLIDSVIQSIRKIYPESYVASIPTENALMSATKSNPCQWDEPFPKTIRQCDASYAEQKQIQLRTKLSIDSYIACSGLRTAKNFLITGSPGTGKTHCLNHSIMYALSQGLFCMTTAVLADRAFLLGGQHFHKLFKLPVRNMRSPQRLAELSVIALQKEPQKLALLRYLDVLFVDELGQLSAEMLSVLDIVLRRIRDSSLFMGGILVIGTLDQVQLRPIKGLPFLLSPYVLTTFNLGTLKHYVRCADCPVSQEINQIVRTFVADEVEWNKHLDRLIHLLETHCQFVLSWDDPVIDDTVIRIFPKREQKDKAVRDFMRTKKKHNENQGIKTYTSRAQDEMTGLESHADGIPASQSAVHYLNWKCDEPELLHLYRRGVYQFTYNHPGRFNATQLGVIMEEPSQEAIENFNEIPIWVAPAGTKTVDIQNLTIEDMNKESSGWKRTMVGVAPQYLHTIWKQNIKVKRKQYALVLNIASTIHSAIGHSVTKVATELQDNGIWERAMVVVLLSRVSFARHIIFVGDKEANLRAIRRGLKHRNQYDEYMNHVVTVLESITDENVVSLPMYLPRHPFRPKDIPLPIDNSGFVYMLVSACDGCTVYIGETHFLQLRLKQHNSGFGATQTADETKRPWTLFAYVSGFQNDTKLMKSFEATWQAVAKTGTNCNPISIANKGLSLIHTRYKDCHLLFHQDYEVSDNLSNNPL